MGTATRVLIPLGIILAFSLLVPLLLPSHVQLQLQELVSSLRSFKNPITTLPIVESDKLETKTYTLSTNPLVIYITNFITPLEAVQLVALRYLYFPSPILIPTLFSFPLSFFLTLHNTPLTPHNSNDNFRPSPLYSDDGTLSHDTTYRSSLTATLPLSPIVKQVEARAKSFSFHSKEKGEEKKIKPLVVQKYGLGKQYKDHYDVRPLFPTLLSLSIPPSVFSFQIASHVFSILPTSKRIKSSDED